MGNDNPNPTVRSAEEATGMEPLNAQPSKPQPPQHDPIVSDPTVDTVPTALQNLHAPFTGFVLALDAADTRTKSKDTIRTSSDYPDSSKFEDLVKAALKPEGPVRAEGIQPEDVKWPESYREIMKTVETMGEPNDLKVYKVIQGKNKAEIFAVSLDLENDRLVGVKFPEQ
ncbi:hypothetical protein MBLNU230_g8546t1 [Neophaeotheca triangularis]